MISAWGTASKNGKMVLPTKDINRIIASMEKDFSHKLMDPIIKAHFIKVKSMEKVFKQSQMGLIIKANSKITKSMAMGYNTSTKITTIKGNSLKV